MPLAWIVESLEEATNRQTVAYLAHVSAYLNNELIVGRSPDEVFMRAIEDRMMLDQERHDWREEVIILSLTEGFTFDTCPKLQKAIYDYECHDTNDNNSLRMVAPKNFDYGAMSFGQWMEDNADDSKHETIPYIFWNQKTSQMKEFYFSDVIKYMNEWIRNAAYYNWITADRPVGKDTDHWHQAIGQFVQAHL